MRLYNIQSEMEALLNQVDENGCLPDDVFENIEQLQIAESEKIEAIACYLKDLKAEQEALANEIGILQERKRVKQNKEESLRAYLTGYLISAGKLKFESPRCALSFRRSEPVEVIDESAVIKFADAHIDMGLVKTKTEVVKTAIKAAIKSGIDIPGAALVERQSLQVK